MKKLALLIALLPSVAFAYDCKSPETFASSVSTDVVAIVEAGGSDAATETKLRDMFVKIVDSERMAKFVLGKNYRTLKPEEQTEFQKVYHEFLLTTYVPSFKKYNGQKVEVVNSKPTGADSIVETKIISDGEPDILINYRLEAKDGCYKVADIIAEGVSLINTQRQDFDSIINRKGYPELVNILKQKSKSQ